MFACINGQTLSKSAATSNHGTDAGQALVNLAFTFSPLVERTTDDTVVVDIEGQEHLFHSNAVGKTHKVEWIDEIANQIAQCASREHLKVNVAVAANPDAAIHTARAFNGITVVPQSEELAHLSKISLTLIDYSLAAIDEWRAQEIRETFALWGLRTFGDFAQLPLAGVAQRLGQEGVRLQKLARGTSDRNLVLVQPPIGFEQSLELEHPVTELEPLSFILSRLLNQLCANLNEYALATNELRVRLVTEPRAIASGSTLQDQEISSSDRVTHERTISLPVPMQNSKTFFRLCLLDLESHPPQAPVTAVLIAAEPTKPRVLQNGLFIPLAPEPEKLEVTLARLAKLVGPENIGSPELLDTHRPDAFRMKRFSVSPGIVRKKGKKTIYGHTRNDQKAGSSVFVKRSCDLVNRPCVIGFRVFRPPGRAEVLTMRGEPVRINARTANSSCVVRGRIVKASGPWRASGDWWRADVWARDEWDVTVADAKNQNEILCRIFRDLASEEWFVEGIYD